MRTRSIVAKDRRRGTSQERSVERRSKIARAAIEILAAHGVAGLTHRLVAAQADVSLAATTYYFDSKHDIVAEASGMTLRGYVDSFRRAADRMRREGADSSAFRQFIVRLISNAVTRDRVRTLCWAEIILDARRHPQSMMLSRQWFAELRAVWTDIAKAAGIKQPALVARSAIDLVIGFLFMTLSLGLDGRQVNEVLVQGHDPLKKWDAAGFDPPRETRTIRQSAKSLETRERILSVTVELLISEGSGAITYRNIAKATGLTAAAPFYHFPTVASLLSAAEQRLFEQSKQRYRLAAPGEQILRSYTLDQLIDRTTTVYLREATEYAGKNLALYAIWLEAARNPNVRPMVWSAIRDLHRAWHRVLCSVTPGSRPVDALIAQAGFIGKTLRVISTGSSNEELAGVRAEFAYDLRALVRSDFYL